MPQLRVVRTVAALRGAVAGWRRQGQRVALVPTMGALHAGHLSLIRLARRHAKRVIVSIFVNPAQFGPQEDFGRYPRTWKTDLKMLAAEQVSLVFAPSTAEVYPPGFATRIVPEGAARGLESDFRPHFFTGVATVVAKLLIQTMPDIAIFGEKDYQQLLVVKRLVRDLDLPIKIVAAPTIREPDGLALSSRNAYLSGGERRAAPSLFHTLQETAQAIADGKPVGEALAAGRRRIQSAGFQIDYLDARHPETLAPAAEPPMRLLAAARLGSTRLIDNVAVSRGSPGKRRRNAQVRNK